MKLVIEKVDSFPIKEAMKYRFKQNSIPWAFTLSEMPFDDSIHEFGIKRKELIAKKNHRAKKPYWQKKRRQQKRWRKNEKRSLMMLRNQ